MKKRTTTAGWIARVLCIAAILFVSMFALDSFEHGTFLEKMAAFGLHMIPSAVLILVLVLSWKNELAGGVLFLLVGIGFAPFIYNLNHDRNKFSVVECLQILAAINLPFIIIGSLFMYSYFKLKKSQAVV